MSVDNWNMSSFVLAVRVLVDLNKLNDNSSYSHHMLWLVLLLYKCDKYQFYYEKKKIITLLYINTIDHNALFEIFLLNFKFSFFLIFHKLFTIKFYIIPKMYNWNCLCISFNEDIHHFFTKHTLSDKEYSFWR